MLFGRTCLRKKNKNSNYSIPFCVAASRGFSTASPGTLAPSLLHPRCARASAAPFLPSAPPWRHRPPQLQSRRPLHVRVGALIEQQLSSESGDGTTTTLAQARPYYTNAHHAPLVRATPLTNLSPCLSPFGRAAGPLSHQPWAPISPALAPTSPALGPHLCQARPYYTLRTHATHH